MSESTGERVRNVLRSVLGPKVDPQALRLGSLKMLEVVVALENEFGVSIPDDAPLAKLTSSADEIVRFVDGLSR